MATTVLTVNPQLITVSGTTDHDINFDNILQSGSQGQALVTVLSGTTIRFNQKGAVDLTNSATYTVGDKEIIPIQKGETLHYRGGAGSEVFKISIV